jgi:hypothetical protein
MSGKLRHCWNCGDEMGVIEDRYYDRMDTCGKRECERAARYARESERAEAHRSVDEDF